jgi:ribosomal protein S11
LSGYWRLKFNFFFSNVIWDINEKIFISLWAYKFITGKLFIKKTATNLIVTLTDLFGKVIYCATSYVSLRENKKDKRRRLSTFAIENIIDKLYGYISLYDIGHLIIISRIKSRILLFALTRKLKFYGLKIFGHIKEFVNPHNGVKHKKLKRK